LTLEPTAHIGKRKNRSELFVKGLFDENDFPPGHNINKQKLGTKARYFTLVEEWKVYINDC
jgi:hypothetical protein